MNTIRVAAVILTLNASVMSFAQSISFDDVLSGSKYPSMLKLEDLKSNYKALKLTVAGSSAGLGDSLGALMPMMMGRGQTAQPGSDLYSLFGTYWTTGVTTDLGGHTFLVTYKLEMGIGGSPTSSSPISVSLKLNLVRTDMISSIGPEPDVTPERLQKDLIDAKVGFNDPTSVSIGGDSAISAAILAPVMVQARQAAVNTSNLSNAKQVALGLIMYQNDYDDVFPYTQSTGAAVEVTQPYLKNLSVWWTTDGRRFLFNPALGGVAATTIPDPAQTILIFAEQPASDGKREVAFADGHAKRITVEEWNTYLATLKAHFAKTAKRPLPVNLGQQYNGAKPASG